MITKSPNNDDLIIINPRNNNNLYRQNCSPRNRENQKINKIKTLF